MLGLNWGGQRVGWKWEQEVLAMVGGVCEEGGWSAQGKWVECTRRVVEEGSLG
jgi:hypothetical protein